MLFRGEFADFGIDGLSVAGNIVYPFETFSIPASATSTSQTIFTCDAAYQLVSVSESHTVASSSGTLMVEKCTGTTAPGSGTAQLTGTVSLAGAANTTLSGTLLTAPTINYAKGDRVSLKFAGTMTSLANSCITVVLKRI